MKWKGKNQLKKGRGFSHTLSCMWNRTRFRNGIAQRYVVVCVRVCVHVHICMGWNALVTGNHQQNKTMERWTVRAMCASGCGNNSATGTLVKQSRKCTSIWMCASNRYRLSTSIECMDLNHGINAVHVMLLLRRTSCHLNDYLQAKAQMPAEKNQNKTEVGCILPSFFIHSFEIWYFFCWPI